MWCSACSAQAIVHVRFGHKSRDLHMVVHGNDVIVAGCGDDWLSQKLNEKLELVQNARLEPDYDSEATMLNHCVTYSDSGLACEADPRHAELAAPSRVRTGA